MLRVRNIHRCRAYEDRSGKILVLVCSGELAASLKVSRYRTNRMLNHNSWSGITGETRIEHFQPVPSVSSAGRCPGP